MNDSVVLPWASLQQLVADIFAASGVGREAAGMVAESLVDANLCGHDSHGVVRVMEYVALLKNGGLNPHAELTVTVRTPVALVCDAGLGFGQVQMRQLIDRVIPAARESGLACAAMRNCGHVGRLGEWVERIARAGLVGLMTVNDNGVLKCVAPPGGVEPCISTNPLAIGVPQESDPVVLDMSTSMVANGKIRVAQLAGESVPDGWLIDADGQPTNDPETRFADPPGTILPMGGYKGFGLGLLLDLLVGGLCGGGCPPADEGTVECNNVLLLVIDPDRFSGSVAFGNEVDKLLRFARANRRRDESRAIRLPGDRSAACREERRRNGIPVNAGTWRGLRETADSRGVEWKRFVPGE